MSSSLVLSRCNQGAAGPLDGAGESTELLISDRLIHEADFNVPLEVTCSDCLML